MKFLIIRLSSLGDVIHTLPILNELREKYPSAQIDWLTSNKGHEILSLIKGIDNLYLVSSATIKRLQKERYDFVIDVQGLFKTAFIGKLIQGRTFVGFKNTREFAHLFYDKKVDVGNLFNTREHITDLNLKLVSSITQRPLSKVNFSIPKLTNLNKTISLPDNALIFPATTWKSKHWLNDYWFEVINNIHKKYNVSILAPAQDQTKLNPLVKKLESNQIKFNNLIGKTDLKDLIYLIQNSKLVVGLDSAGLHLASAIKNDYGMPEVLGIYGPTSSFRNGPYNMIENGLYLKDLECIPCRKKICPLEHNNCMKELLPEYVISKINTLAEIC